MTTISPSPETNRRPSFFAYPSPTEEYHQHQHQQLALILVILAHEFVGSPDPREDFGFAEHTGSSTHGWCSPLRVVATEQQRLRSDLTKAKPKQGTTSITSHLHAACSHAYVCVHVCVCGVMDLSPSHSFTRQSIVLVWKVMANKPQSR